MFENSSLNFKEIIESSNKIYIIEKTTYTETPSFYRIGRTKYCQVYFHLFGVPSWFRFRRFHVWRHFYARFLKIISYQFNFSTFLHFPFFSNSITDDLQSLLRTEIRLESDANKCFIRRKILIWMQLHRQLVINEIFVSL